MVHDGPNSVVFYMQGMEDTFSLRSKLIFHHALWGISLALTGALAAPPIGDFPHAQGRAVLTSQALYVSYRKHTNPCDYPCRDSVYIGITRGTSPPDKSLKDCSLYSLLLAYLSSPSRLLVIDAVGPAVPTLPSDFGYRNFRQLTLL